MKFERDDTTGCYFGPLHRLCVRRHKRHWTVFDAYLLPDKELMRGKGAPRVAEFDNLDAALQYCSRVMSGELKTEVLP